MTRNIQLTDEECYAIAHSPLPNKILAEQYSITPSYVGELKRGRARGKATGIQFKQKRLGRTTGDRATILKDMIKAKRSIQDIAKATGYSSSYIRQSYAGYRNQLSLEENQTIDRYFQPKSTYNFSNTTNWLTVEETKIIDKLFREDDSLEKQKKRSYEEILIKSGIQKTPSWSTLRNIEYGNTRKKITGRHKANKNTRKKLDRYDTIAEKTTNSKVSIKKVEPKVQVKEYQFTNKDCYDIALRIHNGENIYDVQKDYPVSVDDFTSVWSIISMYGEDIAKSVNRSLKILHDHKDKYKDTKTSA